LLHLKKISAVGRPEVRRRSSNQHRKAIAQVLTALAKMDLTVSVKGHDSGDYERIATLVNCDRSNLAKKIDNISEYTQVLAATSTQLEIIAKDLAKDASETSRLAADTARSSEKVSTDLNVVTVGSNEMLTSIREISQNTSRPRMWYGLPFRSPTTLRAGSNIWVSGL
jgi:methyl-accepting chemotaxis protein